MNHGAAERKAQPVRRTSGGRVVGSVASNFGGFAVRLGAALVTTPLFIAALGPGDLGQARYGSWVFLWGIGAYLSILDLGLGLAIRRFVARALGTGDIEERDRMFGACLSVYMVLSALVLAVGLPLAGMPEKFLQLDPSVAPIAWKMEVFVVLDVAVQFPTNAFQGLLTAYQRYELTNAIRVSAEVLRNVLLIGAAWMGFDVVALAGLQFATSVATFGAIAYAAVRVASPLTIPLFRLDRRLVLDILTYSGWVVVYLAALQALNLSSGQIVGHFFPPAAAVQFAVAYSLMRNLAGIPTLMTNVLVPFASEREAQSDWSSIQRTFIIGSNGQALIAAPSAMGALCLGGAFFQLWLGPGFARSPDYLLLLLLPILFAQGTGSSIALGTGRQAVLACITMISTIATVACAAWAAGRWGTMGVCVSYSVLGTLSNLSIYAYSARFLRLEALRSTVRIWAAPFLAALGMGVFLRWTSPLIAPDRSFLRFCTAMLAGGAAYVASVAAIYALGPGWLPAVEKMLGLLDRFRGAGKAMPPAR